VILLISASWVARITGMSYRCVALSSLFIYLFFIKLFLFLFFKTFVSTKDFNWLLLIKSKQIFNTYFECCYFIRNK
jgi:hypothetical protein